MGYLERYKYRLEQKGASLPDSLINKAKTMIDNNFHTSPSFTQIELNGIITDAIVNNKTKHDEKLINFRPNSIVDIGSLVKYKENNYILTELFEDGIYISSTVQLCNSTFLIEANKTTVLMKDENGNDVFDSDGRPVYTIVTVGTDNNEPCIVSNTVSYGSEDEQIQLPEGIVHITMKYQTAENIKEDVTFMLYNSTYEIKAIDYTKVIQDKGIMVIHAKKVVNN